MLLRPRQKLFVERSLAALSTRDNTLGVAPTCGLRPTVEDLVQHGWDPLFLCDDRVHDLGRRAMIGDRAGMRVLDVQVAGDNAILCVALDQISRGDLPGSAN